MKTLLYLKSKKERKEDMKGEQAGQFSIIVCYFPIVFFKKLSFKGQLFNVSRSEAALQINITGGPRFLPALADMRSRGPANDFRPL